MRRIILLIALLVVSFAARAEGERELLGRVADYVAALGNYEVEFNVAAGDYTSQGRYLVWGDAYYILLDKAEVYSDGKLRYEIDRERKEVNIDNIDLQSRNILDNPTRCFDFVDDEYSSQILKRECGIVTVRLVARDEQLEGEILLRVDEMTGRPLGVEYHLYEDSIQIDISSIKSTKNKIMTFKKSDYKDYDIVDFR